HSVPQTSGKLHTHHLRDIVHRSAPLSPFSQRIVLKRRLTGQGKQRIRYTFLPPWIYYLSEFKFTRSASRDRFVVNGIHSKKQRNNIGESTLYASNRFETKIQGSSSTPRTSYYLTGIIRHRSIFSFAQKQVSSFRIYLAYTELNAANQVIVQRHQRDDIFINNNSRDSGIIERRLP